VLLRLPGDQGMSAWTAGTRIGMTVATEKAIAFASSDRAQT
jgi:hypothetical protein